MSVNVDQPAINGFEDDMEDDEVNPGELLEKQFEEKPQMTIDGSKMLKAMQCPICMNTFSADIYQCTAGHAFCASCLSNDSVRQCPTCRVPIDKRNPVRNRVMYDLFDMMGITIPCKYKNKGCTEDCKYSALADHVAKCKFAPKRCEIDGCKSEIGTTENYLMHLMSSHANMSPIDPTYPGAAFFELRCEHVATFLQQQQQTTFMYHYNDDVIFVMFEQENTNDRTVRVQAFSYNSVPYMFKIVIQIPFRCEEFEVRTLPFDDFKKILTRYAQEYKKGSFQTYLKMIQDNYMNYCIDFRGARFLKYAQNHTLAMNFNVRDLSPGETKLFVDENSGKDVDMLNGNETLTPEIIRAILGDDVMVDENGYVIDQPPQKSPYGVPNGNPGYGYYTPGVKATVNPYSNTYNPNPNPNLNLYGGNTYQGSNHGSDQEDDN